MDVFSRSFFPTAAESELTAAVAGRHLKVLRQCVDGDDSAVLVTRCTRQSRPLAGEYLLLLTTRRLVITHESRVLRRMSLHLNANLRHLSNVTWTADLPSASVEVAATAMDGVRERFTMNAHNNDGIRHVERLFTKVFRERAAFWLGQRQTVLI
jgi:hypothetical protein